MNKEARRKLFKSMTSEQRKELILKKKAKEIKVGSGVPDKKYENEEVYELIHIVNRFPELREKGKINN